MKKQIEHQIISHVTEHSEATMNSVASNSIGMILLKLKDRYTDQCLSKAQWVSQLTEALGADLNSEYTALIYFMQEKMEEPVQPFFDTVTLYLLGGEGPYEERILMPLSIVCSLVFKALMDDAKFTHHYKGSPAQQVEQARADRPMRLLSLFRCFQRIKQGDLCHQGIRNALVLLLNYTYEGVFIIEDAAASATYLLKEKIHARLFHVLMREQDDKIAFGRALFTWITEDNVSPLCDLIDPTQCVDNEIMQYFMAHGSDPTKVMTKYGLEPVSLPEFVAKMKTTLDFSPDVNQAPLLCMIKGLFQETPSLVSPSKREQALLKIQQWVETIFIYNITQNNQMISDFYVMNEAGRQCAEYQMLLMMTNREAANELAGAEVIIQNYYDTIIDSSDIASVRASKAAFQTAQQLRQLVQRFKKDQCIDEISNFFASWAAAGDEDQETRKRLYALLLNKHFKKKSYGAMMRLKRFKKNIRW